MSKIPFTAIDWTSVEPVEVKGEKGLAHWKTLQLPGLRIRLVEYSENFLVDHWCQKGHIIHCLRGSFVTELATGEKVTLKTNDSFVVSDDASSHLTYSENGAQLLIIDGDFLKP
jgi:hypothetical protein